MSNQKIYYSFARTDAALSDETHLSSTDYVKQASRSSSMVRYLITTSAMMLTLTVCSSAPSMEKEPKLTYNKPDTEIVQHVLVNLQGDIQLAEENKRQNLKIETMALAKLVDNWDEEGAMRVSTTAIKNVLNLLDHASIRIDLLQDIYANPNGTISVEWENDNNEFAGMQIGRKQMSYYVTHHSGSDYGSYEKISEENYQKFLTKLALL